MKIADIEFNPGTANFQAGNALVLGMAAELSYADRHTIERKTAGWGLPHCRFISVRDTQAFVASNEQVIIVAFRGTEPANIKDWLTDARTTLVQGPAGRVHAGFQAALDYAWPDVDRALREFQGGGKSLWFTGHSLGAALATLAVARLRLGEDRPVNGLYTFGQPRTGDREFQFRFDFDFKPHSFRFVNNADVVPRVPLRLMFYSHVGSFVYFDKDGNASADRGLWFRLLDRAEGRLIDWDDLLPKDIADHSMQDGYLPNLKRLYQQNTALF